VTSELATLVGVFRKWLHLPDEGALLASLAAAATNQLDGDPVWLLLVGPPGGGKSELLDSLLKLPHVHPTATLTEAALLSGTPKREKESGAKGGLLREIGDYGIVVCKDFGSILSMGHDARAAVLAALREIYDGAWTRHVGTGGGRTLAWSGKVGLLAGCTPTIDRHHAVMGAMGERFVLYRLPVVDNSEQARQALAHAGHERAMRAVLSGAVEDLFMVGLKDPGERSQDDDERLVGLAELVARCRSAVVRDSYSREIELIPQSEAPTRIVVVLARLLSGLDAIGCDRDRAWHVLTKAALASIPAIRRDAMNALSVTDHELETGVLAIQIGYPTKTTRRTLEDLVAHGIAERESGGPGKSDKWRMTGFARSKYAAALTFPEKSGVPITHPNRVFDDFPGKVAEPHDDGYLEQLAASEIARELEEDEAA
jgi:hypothetical protein